MSKFDEKFDSWFDSLLEEKVEPMGAAKLARRLKVTPDSLSNRKFSRTFADWSRERDPQGISWHYGYPKYYPIVNR